MIQGQWVLFQTSGIVDAHAFAGRGQVSVIDAFIGNARPTLENEAGRWFFIAPLLGRLAPVEGQIAPGLVLMPKGTSLEVKASTYEGHASLNPLAELRRFQVHAQATGPHATQPIQREDFADLRSRSVADRLTDLRAFIRERALLAYQNARMIPATPLGASLDAIEVFNLGIRGLLLRPELVVRASRDGDRTKRRIAITQNGGCRSHKTAHRDHLAQVR